MMFDILQDPSDYSRHIEMLVAMICPGSC
jgi:hypothetical protein